MIRVLPTLTCGVGDGGHGRRRGPRVVYEIAVPVPCPSVGGVVPGAGRGMEVVPDQGGVTVLVRPWVEQKTVPLVLKKPEHCPRVLLHVDTPFFRVHFPVSVGHGRRSHDRPSLGFSATCLDGCATGLSVHKILVVRGPPTFFGEGPCARLGLLGTPVIQLTLFGQRFQCKY